MHYGHVVSHPCCFYCFCVFLVTLQLYEVGTVITYIIRHTMHNVYDQKLTLLIWSREPGLETHKPVAFRGGAAGADRTGCRPVARIFPGGSLPCGLGVECRKILAFSPSRWCILMHSGARFRPTRPITAIMMFMTSAEV